LICASLPPLDSIDFTAAGLPATDDSLPDRPRTAQHDDCRFSLGDQAA